MKKIYSIFAVTALVLAPMAFAYCQHLNKTESPAKYDFINRYFDSSKHSEPSPGIPVTEIKSKAVRSFLQSFDGAENVSWFTPENGIVALFKLKGISTRADYDKKGNWLYTIRTYGESLLPKNIRAQVKTVYFDYSITAIHEVQYDVQVAYIINIEDNESLKTLTIVNGEMNVMKEYEKSK